MKSAREAIAGNDSRELWTLLIDTAVREVFDLMLGCQLTVPESPEGPPPELTAKVGLTGQLSGVLSIRCSGKAAVLMASKMLGKELHEAESQASDALGEVCNMVAGNFKNKISSLAETCMLSPPTVITGTDYDQHPIRDSQVLEVLLQFEGMPILVWLHVYR